MGEYYFRFRGEAVEYCFSVTASTHLASDVLTCVVSTTAETVIHHTYQWAKHTFIYRSSTTESNPYSTRKHAVAAYDRRIYCGGYGPLSGVCWVRCLRPEALQV